jgi:hypothetical protein
MKKSTKVLGVLAILVASTLVVSAGLLSFYGKVETTANVEQSVVLWDGSDWVNYDTPISEPFGDVTGGSCECSAQSILNRADVEAPIDISTTVDATHEDGSWMNPDGVTTTIYDLSSKLFESDKVTENDGDEYTTLDYYDSNLLVEINHYKNCDIEFVVTTPAALEDGSQDNFALAIDANNNEEADFQVSFHSNKDHSGNYWSYDEFDGSWGDWQTLPGWITADNTGRQVFTIRFSSEELGGCGSDYRFGVSGSFATSDNQINSGENVYFKYPFTFSWSNMNTWEEQTIGTELTPASLTLQPAEEKVLCICYDFAINISPGIYDITTTFVPGTD